MLLMNIFPALIEWMNEYFSSYKSSLTPTCGIKPSIYEECQHDIIYGTPNFNIYFLSVYPKCHFVFLINWNTKLDIKSWFLFLYWDWDIKHKTNWFFHFQNNRTLKFKLEISFSFFILIWQNEKPNLFGQISYKTSY